MTTTQGADPTTNRYSCPISGRPLVRKITFEDRSRSGEHQVPVHIGQRVLFDGEPPSMFLLGKAEVELEHGEATVVTLYALVEDVCAPFEPTDPAEGRFAPAAIGGHQFLTPYDRPWEVVEEDHAGDGRFHVVKCPVLVAEVEVR